MGNFKGLGVALVTPFSENGNVDFAGLQRLVELQINGGTDYLVVHGTTGESVTLTKDEKKATLEFIQEINAGKLPIVVGIGGNNTKEVCDSLDHADLKGVDGILSVSPAYNKPTQEGIYQHYKAIAESVSDLPFMLYNVPGRTVSDIAPQTVIRLFDDVANIYGIKEATGSLERTIALLSQRPELKVFSGDDAIDYPILANGGAGITSVTSNLMPDLKSELVRLALSGDFAGAKAINDTLYPLNSVMFCESNPMPIKAAMYIAGLIPTLEYRLPLVAPSLESMKKIEEVMKNYDIKGL